MSLRATSWALNDVQCAPVFKAILFAIGDHADDDGYAYPSLETIRRKSGIGSKKTVQRRVQDLHDFGVITKWSRSAKGSSHKTNNFYRLSLSKSFDLIDCRHFKPFPAGWGQNVPIGPGCSFLDGDKMSLLLPVDNSADGDKLSLMVLGDGDKMSPPTNLGRDTAVSRSSGPQLCPPNRQLTVNNKYTDNENYLSDDPIEISISWRPSADCLELLRVEKGINQDLASEFIPQFILYWQSRTDRKKKRSQFDALFYKHAIVNAKRRQGEAKPIPADWVPTDDAITLLESEGVPRSFINSTAKTFRVYWCDRGSVRFSWSAVFVTHCLDVFGAPLSGGPAQ